MVEEEKAVKVYSDMSQRNGESVESSLSVRMRMENDSGGISGNFLFLSGFLKRPEIFLSFCIQWYFEIKS